MNVRLHDVKMLEYFSAKYGVDLFLFVNQFEIKTKYEKCMDRAVNNFKREIWVHFSIYDSKGEQLYGNVVGVNFFVQSNDMNSLIRSSFPLIADYITDNLPKQEKLN